MARITIDPLTRLEGHGRVEIFLDASGEVENAYLVVPELRGFERLCVGRPAEEMPRITARICGLCPEAHMMASVKALDDLYGVEPPPAARKIRELLYMAFFVLDHATHFFALAGPDLFLGPDAPPAERNLFGVLRRLGSDVAREIVAGRMRNAEVIALLGGRGVHPEGALPGGWSRPVSEETRLAILGAARANVELALAALKLWDDVVLANAAVAPMLHDETFAERTYSMGTVDEAGRLALYDGRVRVVDPDGVEVARFHPRDYRLHVAERVEPWTYLKMPYLRQVGWRGLASGRDSGVYASTPLARLNASVGMATPRAREERERLYAALGGGAPGDGRRPVHNRFATHWARLVELLYAAERMVELASDPSLTDPDVRARLEATPREGIGCVEAPRGTLTHHYTTDERGIVTGVNLVVGTTNNHAALALSITKAARALLRGGAPPTEGLLNRIEMVIRTYDPCLSCATHAWPGGPSLLVRLRGPEGEVLWEGGRGGPGTP